MAVPPGRFVHYGAQLPYIAGEVVRRKQAQQQVVDNRLLVFDEEDRVLGIHL